MWDKIKIALVLFVIGSLSGIIIYGVNSLTEETIAQNKIEREVSYYKELFNLVDSTEITYDIFDLDNNLDQEVTIFDSNDNIMGYIYKGTDINNYGEITVLVGITTDGEISNVVISSTENTITYVQIIKSEYIANFSGQDVDEFIIDDRTGATFTYTSVVGIITTASEYYSESRGE